MGKALKMIFQALGRDVYFLKYGLQRGHAALYGCILYLF